MYLWLEKDTVVHSFSVSVSLFCRADINLSRVKGVHDLVCTLLIYGRTPVVSLQSGQYWSIDERSELPFFFLAEKTIANKSRSRQQTYVASIEVSMEAKFVNGVLMLVLCFFPCCNAVLGTEQLEEGKSAAEERMVRSAAQGGQAGK